MRLTYITTPSKPRTLTASYEIRQVTRLFLFVKSCNSSCKHVLHNLPPCKCYVSQSLIKSVTIPQSGDLNMSYCVLSIMAECVVPDWSLTDTSTLKWNKFISWKTVFTTSTSTSYSSTINIWLLLGGAVWEQCVKEKRAVFRLLNLFSKR